MSIPNPPLFVTHIISLLIITALSPFALSNASADPIYRCTNSKGERSYQDFPCAAQTQSLQMQVLPAPTLLPQELRMIEQAQAQSQGPSQARTSNRRRTSNTGNQRQSTARRRTSANGSRHDQQQTQSGHAARGKRKKLRAIAQVYRAGCPETTEQSGSYVIKGNSLNLPNGAKQKTKRAMFDAEMHYKSLPSKTYLKNQGLWPAHCD